MQIAMLRKYDVQLFPVADARAQARVGPGLATPLLRYATGWSGMVSYSSILLIAIPDGQNLRQKLQALAVIKMQISIHQKKALSELHRTITALVVANSVDAEVACVFNFSHTNFN